MAQNEFGLAKNTIIDVLIPAVNEEKSIAKVINDIPRDIVRHIIVCDNGSTDATTAIAENLGATVLVEPKRGYGSTCLNGLKWLENLEQKPDILVFLDGDYSDYPEQMPKLIKPIIDQNVDLVIGSRALGELQKGAMQAQQIFGNWLATSLIKLIYGYHFTDLGPFRAIKYDVLRQMNMSDPNYGWTVEMQVKAAKMKLKTTEVPVNYRVRIGSSKVSGTIKGTVLAGHKILWTIFRLI